MRARPTMQFDKMREESTSTHLLWRAPELPSKRTDAQTQIRKRKFRFVQNVDVDLEIEECIEKARPCANSDLCYALLDSCCALLDSC